MLEYPTSQDNITYLALDWDWTLQRQANGESLLTAELLARRIGVVDFLAEQALSLLPQISFPEDYQLPEVLHTDNLYSKFPTPEEHARRLTCRHLELPSGISFPKFTEQNLKIWDEFIQRNPVLYQNILQYLWLYHDCENGLSFWSLQQYKTSQTITSIEYEDLQNRYYEAGFLQQLRLQTFIALQFYYDSLVDFANEKGVTLKGILS